MNPDPQAWYREYWIGKAASIPRAPGKDQWRDWIYSPPSREGHEYVEAYRPDGSWAGPQIIKVGADPALNVAGLHWRPVQS